ncbi:MAG: hypothetical protein QW632_01200 [Ignisphaera sp.]
MKPRVFTILGGYTALEVDANKAPELLNKLRDVLGKGGEDVEDAIRMIQHFDTFYNVMQKKFKDFLTPRKNVSELLKGNVLVDKVKLIKKDNNKLVVIVFDRSVSRETIKDALNNLGYEYDEC